MLEENEEDDEVEDEIVLETLPLRNVEEAKTGDGGASLESPRLLPVLPVPPVPPVPLLPPLSRCPAGAASWPSARGGVFCSALHGGVCWHDWHARRDMHWPRSDAGKG